MRALWRIGFDIRFMIRRRNIRIKFGWQSGLPFGRKNCIIMTYPKNKSVFIRPMGNA